MDHVRGAGVLLHDPVDGQPKLQRLRVWDLVLRHHPRPARARGVKALAFEVLASPTVALPSPSVVLYIARAEIVDHRVAKHVVKGIRPSYVGAALADDQAELDLPVDLVTDSGVDRDRGVRSG